MPSFGDPDPWLLILGLAPAAHGGNRTGGRMFTGDKSGGDWLFASLYRTGYAEQPTATAADDGQALHGVRMVAPPVHCAPPKNAPTPEEKATCGHWLDRELVLLPHVTAIVALVDGLADRARHRYPDGWSVPRPPRVHFTHGAVTEFGTPDGRTIRCLGVLPRVPAQHLHRAAHRGDAGPDLPRRPRLSHPPSAGPLSAAADGRGSRGSCRR